MNESSSNNGRYPKQCLRAAMSEEIFKTFKQNPAYTPILEHVGPKQGIAYLNECKDFLLENNLIEKIKLNDSEGGPLCHDFSDVGSVSPTTLRYAKVLKDVANFCDLNNKDIVEIGGGYGGQYTVLRQFFTPKSYTFVDLPEVNQLISKYINKLNLDDIPIHYINGEEESSIAKNAYDFIMSNYAISEVSNKIVDIYLERYLYKSLAGYVTWNFHTAYPFDKIVQSLSTKSTVLVAGGGDPSNQGQNKVLTWKTE